jgi:hypothetical protein
LRTFLPGASREFNETAGISRVVFVQFFAEKNLLMDCYVLISTHILSVADEVGAYANVANHCNS